MSEKLQIDLDIEVRFFGVLKETVEEYVEGIPLDIDLRDIGINSITFIKLIVALESEFDVEFDDAGLNIENFQTLRQFKEYVEKIVYQNG